MTEFPLQEGSQLIHLKLVSRTPGRVRLRVPPERRDAGAMAEIASGINTFFPQIQTIRTNSQTGSITVYYEPEKVDFENILPLLPSFGIVLDAGAPKPLPETSQASASITSAVAGLNQRLKQTTEGAVDLRFLVPLFFTLLALRQLFAKTPRLQTAPWYVLAWYAFDSFLKLNNVWEERPSKK